MRRLEDEIVRLSLVDSSQFGELLACAFEDDGPELVDWDAAVPPCGGVVDYARSAGGAPGFVAECVEAVN